MSGMMIFSRYWNNTYCWDIGFADSRLFVDEWYYSYNWSGRSGVNYSYFGSNVLGDWNDQQDFRNWRGKGEPF